MCLIGKDFVCQKLRCSTAGTANKNCIKVQVKKNAVDIRTVTEHFMEREKMSRKLSCAWVK
jgi:hypothetical protein